VNSPTTTNASLALTCTQENPNYTGSTTIPVTFRKFVLPTDDDYYNFIWDRTFSIAGTDGFETVRGTGWILNKVNNGSNYEY
jgi:hypothetical protein